MWVSVLLMGWVATSMVSDLPEGWRLPTSAELEYPMLPAGAFTRVSADLDGDGGGDTALLLKSTTSNAEALWVRMSGPEGARWMLVDEISWGPGYTRVDLSMRIDTMEPGVYLCPESEAICRPGPHGAEPVFVLTGTGIEYFRIGSASSVYFWDKTQEKFQRVRLGD